MGPHLAESRSGQQRRAFKPITSRGSQGQQQAHKQGREASDFPEKARPGMDCKGEKPPGPLSDTQGHLSLPPGSAREEGGRQCLHRLVSQTEQYITASI